MKSIENKTKRVTFFIAGFVILSAIILSIGYLYYRYAVKSYRVQIDEELSAIADLKVSQIVHWRNERLSIADVLYKNASFSELVKSYFQNPNDKDAVRELQNWMSLIYKSQSLNGVFLLDTLCSKKIIFSKGVERSTSFVSQKSSVVLRSDKKVVFEDFYWNETKQRVFLKILIPILDKYDNSKVIGIVEMRIDPADYLYPILATWPTPSKTSETRILRREGNEVVFLNNLKFEKNRALTLRMPMNSKLAIPSIKAALGEEGIVEGTDYLGKPVIAAIRTIQGSPWFMVARIDKTEAYAPLKKRLSIMVILVGLLLISIVAVFGIIWKQQSVRFYRDKFEASKKLRKSEERYESLVQTSIDGFWVADAEGQLLEVNDAYCLMTGYPREKLLTMRIRDLEAVETQEITCEYIKKVIASGGFGRFESKHRCADGKIIDVIISIFYLHSQNALLVFVNNITERKQKEEQLIIQGTALNAVANAIVITNISGKIEWVNPAFTKLTGYTLDEVTGKNPRTLKSGKHDAAFYKNLWDAILSGKVWHGEIIDKRKDGSEYTEEMTITPLKNESGEITRFIAIKQDITERKKYEEELIKAKAEADRASIAKSEFLSRMSHELRTPMNSILGFAQLMAMGELMPAHKKGVDHILKSGKHLLDLINEVLDLSRIEAGQLSVSLEPVRLYGIISETLDIVRPLATGQNITLEFPESTFNNFHVKADRQKLKQVLLNLINNAVKFNREGGEVKVACEAGSKEKGVGMNTVRISVIDTGKGIAPDEIQKLFNPFQRIGAEISEVEGTGLGLTVAKKLIEAMGGTIGVESEVGVGSTFWIELPRSEGQIDRHERNGDFVKPETTSVVGGTLLYIEDNVSNIQLVEQILEVHRPGIRLITEMYGRNAVKLATDYKPDLILLDLDLPDIHGNEVLTLLQAGLKTATIPVVVISADAMAKQIEKLLKTGAKDYLTKPLDVIEFLKVIDESIVDKA